MLDSRFMRPESFDNFSWRSAYVMGAMASLAYDRLGDTTVPIIERLGGTIISGSGFHRATNQPNVNMYRFPACNIAAIEGTTNQWVDYLLTIRANPRLLVGGQEVSFPVFFAPYIDGVSADIQRLRQPGKPLFVTGHSLGAALATIAVGRTRAFRADVRTLWTFASPQCVSRNWAAMYDPTHFRIVATGDFVPNLPPNAAYFATAEASMLWNVLWMGHCGTKIEIPGLDTDEIAQRLARRGISNIVQRFGQRIDSHYMAAYMESLWGRLDADGRRDLAWLKSALVGAEFSTVPDIEFEPVTVQERQAPIPALVATEQSEIQRYIGPQSGVRIRLYESSTPDPYSPSASEFSEASFSGYAAASIPAGMSVLSTGGTSTVTDDGLFEFRPDRVLAAPALVRGVYVTMPGVEDVDQLLHYQALPVPRSLLTTKDVIRGRISFDLAAVSQ